MWRRWWALVAAVITPHTTAVYTVALYRQPADATAGLAFGSQPTAVVYDDYGAVAATFDGYCVVDVYSSPSGQEDLFRNGSSLERFRRIPIVDGYCVFDLVSIDTVGTYTIGVSAEDDDNFGFAFVVSDAFDVVVGSPHEIVVAGYPSGGTGGEPFGLQPVINVLDVGGNLISDWSTGSVTAKILDDGELGRYSPNPGAELLPASKTTANFAFGEAQFDGLYINEAGGPYYLLFTAADFGDVTLAGGQRAEIPGMTIYRRAATPTTTAVASINASAVERAGVILDNARPKINASYGVRPISPNGTYYAGDEIFLEIAFDMAVAIPEVYPPVLGLDSGIGAETFASYYSGTGTKVLTFRYTVVEDDNNARFDVWGDSSLGVSSSNGYVRRLSDDPLVDADLDLSDVRRHKSLANLSKIKIDGRYPEIIAYGVANRTTSAGKPVHKGNTTRVDDVVTVSVTYNKPVQVFGAPTLTIDAGRDREAVYSGGNASRTIFFEYVVRVADVQVGDGGSFDVMEAAFGSQDVQFSHEQAGGDLLGWAVATDYASGRMVTSAPGKAYPLPEVQLLTVGGSASATSEEVQAYGVGVLVQAAVQSFTTYVSPGEEVGGTFNLQYSDEDGNLVAASADVPAGIEPMAAAELLMDAYPDLGLVTASREPYDWCACTGAYTWSITFDGLLGTPYVGLLVVDGSSLTGAGATATKVSRDAESSYTNGTWRLALPAAEGSSVVVNETRALLAGASSVDVKTAIEEDLGLDVANVDVADLNDYGARRWAVTFADRVVAAPANATSTSIRTLNDVPLLIAESIDLAGGPGAAAWASPIRDGESPVWGTFAVSFNGAGPSAPIDHDASAAQVEAKLEGLESLEDVDVSKHYDLLGDGTHTYRVTFSKVKEKSDVDTGTGAAEGFSWVGAPVYDLPGLAVDDSALHGTAARAVVHRAGDYDALGQAPPPWAGAVRGARGNHAAEATELAAALMEDLGTGDVTVVRSFASGSLEVQWNITLKDADAYDVLPPLSVDGSRLVNDGVSAVAEELRPMPKRLRGVGHLFTRESSTFVEQALLRPYTAQRQDAFGFGCALDGDMGAVGAPNTDSVESGVNSGAAYAYELTFASTGFANATYSVPEGDAVALRVGRRDGEGFARTIAPGRNMILFVWTFSRNADVTQQEWLKDLYGLHDDRMLAPGSTPAEFLGAGAAHGRASWYGGPSNSSQGACRRCRSACREAEGGDRGQGMAVACT